MKKKFICLILSVLMVLSIMPASVFAAPVKCERPLQFEENIAAELKKLNLFKGVSETDFALRKVPTRIEALVIMLRLMGKESEILAGAYTHPFTDVPSWANNYVGYAYENKLTNGINATKFGTSDATDVQFLTFVLRAMGYSDADGDFTWDNPYKLAEDLGVLDCSVTTGQGFLRADCASISYNALAAQLKDGSGTLAVKLIADGVFTKDAYATAQKNVPDYAGMKQAYGLEDAQWHEYPKNGDEHLENFKLAYLSGDIQYTDNVSTYIWRVSQEDRREENIVKVHFLSHIKNLDAFLLCNNGHYYLASKRYQEYLFTPQEMSGQLIAAYNAAIGIVDMCDRSGSINTTQTELERMKALFSYANTLGIKYDSVAQTNMTLWKQTGGPERCDSAYASLINKEAVCTGFAAGMSLICHVNRIDTSCILLKRNDGHTHIVTYYVVDGEEYVCDLTGSIQFELLQDYLREENWTLDDSVYKVAKQHY